MTESFVDGWLLVRHDIVSGDFVVPESSDCDAVMCAMSRSDNNIFTDQNSRTSPVESAVRVLPAPQDKSILYTSRLRCCKHTKLSSVVGR